MSRAFVLAMILLLLGAAGASGRPDARNGKLAFVSGGDIWSVNPDGSALQNLTHSPARDLHPTWSPSGTRIVFASNRTGRHELWIMDADGSNLRRLTQNRKSKAVDSAPSISPDGRRLAFARRIRGNQDIYVMDLDGTDLRRMTRNRGAEADPAWSPDASRISFTRTFRRGRRTGRDVFIMGADGSSLERLTWGASSYAPAWAPDGRRLAFTRVTARGGEDLWTIRVDGAQPRRVTGGPADDDDAAWAPDGRSLAFSSNRADETLNLFVVVPGTRRPPVRVTTFRDPGGSTGAVTPAWQPLPSTPSRPRR
jgi:TolB protein